MGLLKPGKDLEGGLFVGIRVLWLGISALPCTGPSFPEQPCSQSLPLDTSAWAIEVVHRHEVPRTYIYM